MTDLDDAVWPDVEPDPMDLVNTPGPTLFDQLRHTERTFGQPSPDRTLCPADVETIELWAKVGVPADLSTVEHACELLMLLWRERSTWLAIADELAGET